MALRSGLGSSIGFGEESAFGTAVAPTNHFEARSVDLEPGIEMVMSEGIRGGSRLLRADRYAVTKKAPELSTEVDLLSNAHARLLRHLCNDERAYTTTKTNPGTGLVYLYKYHPLTSDATAAPSATYQVGAPDRGGTVRRMDLSGGVTTEATFSNEVDGILTCGFTAAGKDLVPSSSAITTVSYPSATELMYWTQGTVSVDGTTAEVRSVSMTISHGLDVDRFFIGSDTRSKPIASELATCEIQVETEFGALPGTWASTDMVSKFRAGTAIAFEAKWEADTAIESTTKPFFEAKAPKCYITEAVPSISGGEIIGQTLTLQVVAPTNGDEPLEINYQSSENVT
jgi:hypothetical protein